MTGHEIEVLRHYWLFPIDKIDRICTHDEYILRAALKCDDFDWTATWFLYILIGILLIS